MILLNYKIMMIVFSVIIVVGIIFSVSMDQYIQIYDPDWYGLFGYDKVKDEKKIFIIGSSSVYAINATYINEQLALNEKNYQVYNLADMSDTPRKRLASIQNIISNEPEIVVYGLGILEFMIPLYPSYTTTDFILNPDQFISYQFNDMMEPIREKIPVSPKDRTLMLAKYIIRGPDQHYHPFINFTETPINDFEKIKEEWQTTSYAKVGRHLDVSDSSIQVNQLKKILRELQKNDIKIIIITNPYHRVLIDSFDDSEISNFETMLKDNANEFNFDTYLFQDKYADLNIWREALHIAIQPEAKIFSDDVLQIILKEIEE